MLKRSKACRLWGVFILGILMVLLGWIPARLAITQFQAPEPQAIFVLGGSFERTKRAAELWQTHSGVTVWVSDFHKYLLQHYFILREVGVPDRQMRFDSQATDTVTNFTTLADKFASEGVQHIFLVTSDFHMRRARTIAAIVLGSRGIFTTPVEVPSSALKPESTLKVVRDTLRSVFWLITGKTGARFNPRLETLD